MQPFPYFFKSLNKTSNERRSFQRSGKFRNNDFLRGQKVGLHLNAVAKEHYLASIYAHKQCMYVVMG